MIELRNVTQKYGALTVYENFSLSLEEGKIACILGTSGCGKTTLLNMLAGLVPFSGAIVPMQPCSYIFQQPRLVPNLTVEGNLRLVCRDAARIRDMLGRVGLADKAKAYPVELSGGQAQRVSIARAFLHPSSLLLMDEPFSSLDTALKIRLMRLFAEIWREERRTVLFVTHDVEEAYMLAHRALVLRGGKIAADIDCGGGDLPRRYGEGSAVKDALLAALFAGEGE
ncbi:MAG TPA: ATP-binding cassette domain-containing protein [Candidatus Borkfalkia faecigallinarum]|uniref:ATP-binding cassette domain-containing protein n=1 Tax=Candidatus Borkfalkia faecigallinarum TaxID=2838509 RepID=A0A9D1VUJ7_9FIRM|nr:ATP-binding cassette domain-containing protein [Candidatus Borkfalkia faecigallinarum]